MCGRFALTATPEVVKQWLDLLEIEAFPPRYNIAPTQPILIAKLDETGNRKAALVRWGLVPGWVKDPADFTLLINARAETAAEKPSFRAAMRHRRILIPASGFYEWHRPKDGKKQAWWIKPAEKELTFFGGLMETWSSADGSEIDTACILTTQSNAGIGNIHHRMPVVIEPDRFDVWLDCKNNDPKAIKPMLEPVSDHYFEAIPISDKVNKVSNATVDIQAPFKPEPQEKPRSSRPEDKDRDGGQLDLF